MIGTILFSSKIRYGRNKKNISYYLFIPEDQINNDKFIVASKLGISTKVDHYAKIEILDKESNPPRGAIQIMFGPVNEIESCIKMSLHKYNIFPRQSINLSLKECKVERYDFRECNTFSIDPEGSKDIDDAFHFEIIDEKLQLAIHITDLSDLEIEDKDIYSFVSKFSTFYFNNFADMKNLTLLEESICDENNSLIQGQDRNCISLIINFDKEISYEFKKTIINNKNKITYTKADKLILKNENFKKFIMILENYWGKINDSHELIEKMMIFYNNKMAEYLIEKDIDFPIRVHQGINKDLHEKYIKCQHSIDNSLIKKICYHSAEYVNAKKYDNPFHYGLDVGLYSHATSPLRRVPDFIIQKVFTFHKQYDICNFCKIFNDRLSCFKGAYRDINKIKLIEEMKDSTEREFEAIVTNFSNDRITVYIPDLDIIHPINFLRKIKDLIEIEVKDLSIKISHIESKDFITLDLLQKVKIKIMITPYEFSMNKKIRLYLLKPNLIDDIFE